MGIIVPGKKGKSLQICINLGLWDMLSHKGKVLIRQEIFLSKILIHFSYIEVQLTLSPCLDLIC